MHGKIAKVENEKVGVRVLWTPQQKEVCQKLLLKALNERGFRIFINFENMGVETVDADLADQIAGSVFHQISSCFFRLAPFHFAIWIFFHSKDVDFLADKRFFGSEEVNLSLVPLTIEELKESFERYADEGLRDFLLGVFEKQGDGEL